MKTVDKIAGNKIWGYLAFAAGIVTVAILVVTGKEVFEAIKVNKDKTTVKEELEDIATETLINVPEDQKSGCSGCSGAGGNYKTSIISENNWLTR